MHPDSCIAREDYVKAGEDIEPWLAQWHRLGAAFTAAMPAGAGGPPGLSEAAGVFTRFAADYSRLARSAAGEAATDADRMSAELRAMSERFVISAFPSWPVPPGADAEWVRALDAWSTVLRGIAAETANLFAARLRSARPPTSLRATFDAWIDCAEAAFQASAHSDAFIAGQTRLINEFVTQKARQQQLIERGARALGLPTRSEVDALHDAVRAMTPAAVAVVKPPRKRAPKRRTVRKGRR
jgi:Poly(R)-hydroxyalkanoic acid synthase subunit (PHA_synth_III_E)